MDGCRLTVIVGTTLITSSLALACGPKKTVNEGPEPQPQPSLDMVNPGPQEELDAGEESGESGESGGPSSDTDPPEEVLEGPPEERHVNTRPDVP